MSKEFEVVKEIQNAITSEQLDNLLTEMLPFTPEAIYVPLNKPLRHFMRRNKMGIKDLTRCDYARFINGRKSRYQWEFIKAYRRFHGHIKKIIYFIDYGQKLQKTVKIRGNGKTWTRITKMPKELE